MSLETAPDCTAARRWLSAFRDGEALPDGARRAHVDACPACTGWERELDAATRRLVLHAAGGSPDVTAAALVVWNKREVLTRGEGAETPRQQVVGRLVLGTAGAVGLALAAASFIVADPLGAGHLARDLVAFEAALSLGFVLAAWRPGRYGRGLLPVTAVAGVLSLLHNVTAVAGTSADLLAEASHLPVLVGLAGLFLLIDAGTRGLRIPSPR